MRTAKPSFSVIAVSFAVMILGVHQTGGFFPWVHAFGLVAALNLILVATVTKPNIGVSLATITAVAIALRVFLYSWPASTIGMDPDNYAVAVNRVIQQGSTEFLEPLTQTYSSMPAFHIFNAIVSTTAGFEGQAVLIAMPIALGAAFPLTAAALTRRAGADTAHTLLAAIIATFLAIGVWASYWPIAQALGVIISATFILLLTIAVSTGNKNALGATFLCTVPLLFTHPTALFIPSLIVLTAVLAYYIKKPIVPVKSLGVERAMVEKFGMVGMIIATCLAVQWVFLTEFSRRAFLSQLLPYLSTAGSITSADPNFVSAVEAAPGIGGILARRAHFFIIAPIVAIAGVWVWYRRQDASISLVIGGAGVTVALSAALILGFGAAAPRRIALYGVPMFGAVVALAIMHRPKWVPGGTMAIALAILTPLLVAQVGGAVFAPDYPNEPRYYLTSGEVDAKTFMTGYSSDDVAMDYFYSREQIDLTSRDANPIGGGSANFPGTDHLGDVLLNATLPDSNISPVLLRERLEANRFNPGNYRLTWNPIEEMDLSVRHERIYDNGHAVGYRRNSP